MKFPKIEVQSLMLKIDRDKNIPLWGILIDGECKDTFVDQLSALNKAISICERMENYEMAQKFLDQKKLIEGLFSC